MNTKKNYIWAANHIKQMQTSKEKTAVINAFVVFFSNDNSRFNKDIFISACFQDDVIL